MTKQRKKYAAIGEQVRIVTPKEFVRCGYPLTIKLVMEQQFEEIEKDCVQRTPLKGKLQAIRDIRG